MVAVWCHFRPGLPAGALLHCQGVWCQTSHPVALRSALPAVCSHSDVCLFCVRHFTGPGHGVVGRLRVAAFYKRRKTELAGTALCAVPTGRTGLSVGADLYHCCLHRGYVFRLWAQRQAAAARSCAGNAAAGRAGSRGKYRPIGIFQPCADSILHRHACQHHGAYGYPQRYLLWARRFRWKQLEPILGQQRRHQRRQCGGGQRHWRVLEHLPAQPQGGQVLPAKDRLAMAGPLV